MLADDYPQITDILRDLKKRVHRKNIFFSGTARDYAPLGRDRVLGLLRRLGGALIAEGFNLVSGMGLGIGDAVAMGAIEAVYRTPGEHLDARTVLRPFPQAEAAGDLAAIKLRYRQEMLGRARSAIFVLGNKLDSKSGTVIPADGVIQEYKIGRELGVLPIPIGSTGHVAAELSKEVRAQLDDIYGPLANSVRPHLEDLADEKADDSKILNAVLAILKVIAPK